MTNIQTNRTLLNASAFELSRWRGGRCACDTPDIVGCQDVVNRLSPLFANSLSFTVAGESRFNSHSLTASAAHASGSLQTALSKLPDENLAHVRASMPGQP
jgi:hypothetical protein